MQDLWDFPSRHVYLYVTRHVLMKLVLCHIELIGHGLYGSAKHHFITMVWHISCFLHTYLVSPRIIIKETYMLIIKKKNQEKSWLVG